jgi:hypothetical protein
MAIDAVSSSTSAAAAQLIEQTRQANAKPEATETKASETRAEQRQETRPEPAQPAPPVVNTQGQVTGQVINTSA